MARATVTNWECQCVTLAGYCYAMRQGMKIQLVTPYRVSLLQCYSVTVRGNVTSVYPPLEVVSDSSHSHHQRQTTDLHCHIQEHVHLYLYLEHMYC